MPGFQPGTHNARPGAYRVRNGPEGLFPAAGRLCSIEFEPRGSEAAIQATVGEAERRQAADQSRRNIVKLALCKMAQGVFLLACEILPPRHVPDPRTRIHGLRSTAKRASWQSNARGR